MICRVNKYFILLFFISLVYNLTYAQNLIEKRGHITYISSQNIYVKFDNTNGILQNDTLYTEINKKVVPAVLVKYISSVSVAGERIVKQDFSLNDILVAFVKSENSNSEIKKDSAENDNLSLPKKNTESKTYSSNEIRRNYRVSNPPVSGRFSIQSYTGASNYITAGNYQRWRYNFSLYANNISGSKLSFSNYMSFSYRTNEWQDIKNNFAGNLRVYDFALNYRFNKNTNIWVGRHLNSKITNISSIDGAQFEFSPAGTNYSFGFVAGSRPDFANMGFNIKLFEFGGYISRIDTASSGVMENSFALMQQTNAFKIDRRFLYFQHSNNVINNLSLFLSSEIDLYKIENGKSKNDFSLTGMYLSARYSPVKIISFILSYDARKNVIYYETFKTYIQTLIDNAVRQGIRGGISLHPINKMFINLNTGYRFSQGDVKPSRNYNAYISYSQIPFLELAPSFSFTKLITSYVNGTTAEIRVSKDISFLNSDLSIGYERVDYSFSYNTEKLTQNIFSADLYFRMLNKLYLNFNYEGTFQKKLTDNRILIGLIQRF